MDRLGEDFDRNFGVNQKNLERLANQKVWRAKAGQFKQKTAHLAASQRYRPQFKQWFAQSQVSAAKRADVAKMAEQLREDGAHED